MKQIVFASFLLFMAASSMATNHTLNNHSELEFHQSLENSIKKNDIAKLQKMLKSIGYNPGPIDGILGGKTIRALDKYYADYPHLERTAELQISKHLSTKDLESLYLIIKKGIPVYLVDANKKTCQLVKTNNVNNKFVSFRTSRFTSGRINLSNGSLMLSRKPSTGKIFDRGAHARASRCSNVRRFYETTQEQNSAIYDTIGKDSYGTPVVWLSKTKESYCLKHAIYDNCAIQCAQRIRSGSPLYYLVATKEIANEFISKAKIRTSCE